MVKYDMCDMISSIILGGQLNVDQEDALQKLLIHRSHERRCSSLSDYIKRESRKLADKEAEEIREVQSRLYKYCIRGSSIGEMGLSNIKEDDIRKFVIQTAELYEMDRKSWLVFLSMLQNALNAMAHEGVVDFEPPRRIPENFLETVKRKRGIENPYAGEELGRMKAWLEQNPKDVRGLAIALWFEGGISPEEIVGLKKSDLMDGSGKCSCENPVVIKRNSSEDYMILIKKRKRIIRDALELYPGADQKYVFMDENDGVLEKLSKTSLQPKMSHICRQVGVIYKSFKCTDMILWGLD